MGIHPMDQNDAEYRQTDKYIAVWTDNHEEKNVDKAETYPDVNWLFIF
jgi:hypothetical protein